MTKLKNIVIGTLILVIAYMMLIPIKSIIIEENHYQKQIDSITNQERIVQDSLKKEKWILAVELLKKDSIINTFDKIIDSVSYKYEKDIADIEQLTNEQLRQKFNQMFEKDSGMFVIELQEKRSIIIFQKLKRLEQCKEVSKMQSLKINELKQQNALQKTMLDLSEKMYASSKITSNKYKSIAEATAEKLHEEKVRSEEKDIRIKNKNRNIIILAGVVLLELIIIAAK